MKAKLLEPKVWEVKTEKGPLRASTLEVLSRLVKDEDLEVDLPGGLKQMAHTWADLEKRSKDLDRQRRAVFDKVVDALISMGWSRADVAFFVGKSQTVIRRSIARSAEEFTDG